MKRSRSLIDYGKFWFYKMFCDSISDCVALLPLSERRQWSLDEQWPERGKNAPDRQLKYTGVCLPSHLNSSYDMAVQTSSDSICARNWSCCYIRWGLYKLSMYFSRIGLSVILNTQMLILFLQLGNENVPDTKFWGIWISEALHDTCDVVGMVQMLARSGDRESALRYLQITLISWMYGVGDS